VRAQGSRSLPVMERLQRSTQVVLSSIVTKLELAAASGLGQVQRGRMVRAERPVAALQGVLAQGAGRPHLARPDQREGEGAGGGQGVGMVGAEDRPPAVEQRTADGPADGAVSVGLQVPASVPLQN
jgi:hypothetical protein